ncbi:hypothetical protein HNR27_001154 [Ornithinibacillus bavariensis]
MTRGRAEYYYSALPLLLSPIHLSLWVTILSQQQDSKIL